MGKEHTVLEVEPTTKKLGRDGSPVRSKKVCRNARITPPKETSFAGYMAEYEKTTRQIGKINDRKGTGWALVPLTALGEAGMFAYGVQEVIAHPGFWVVVWKIATYTLGGKKEDKTTYWQRVDKE